MALRIGQINVPSWAYGDSLGTRQGRLHGGTAISGEPFFFFFRRSVLLNFKRFLRERERERMTIDLIKSFSQYRQKYMMVMIDGD